MRYDGINWSAIYVWVVETVQQYSPRGHSSFKQLPAGKERGERLGRLLWPRDRV